MPDEPNKPLTTAARRRANLLLDRARDHQAALWDTLSEIEGLLDVEIDSTTDLHDVTLADLMRG